MAQDISKLKSKIFGQTWLLLLAAFYCIYFNAFSNSMYVYIASLSCSLVIAVIMYKYTPMKYYNRIYIFVIALVLFTVIARVYL